MSKGGSKYIQWTDTVERFKLTTVTKIIIMILKNSQLKPAISHMTVFKISCNINKLLFACTVLIILLVEVR